MTDAPKPRSFIVVLNFAPPGPLTVGSWIAPDEAFAAALAAISAARQFPGRFLVNCLVVEESAEMLRTRLRAIEGKPVGDVVSLVQPEPPQSQRAAELLREPTQAPDNSDALLKADLDKLRPVPWVGQSRAPWAPDDPFDPVA